MWQRNWRMWAFKYHIAMLTLSLYSIHCGVIVIYNFFRFWTRLTSCASRTENWCIPSLVFSATRTLTMECSKVCTKVYPAKQRQMFPGLMSLRSNHQLTITHGAMSLSLTLSVFTPVIPKMLGLLQEVQLVLLSVLPLWSSALQSS